MEEGGGEEERQLRKGPAQRREQHEARVVRRRGRRGVCAADEL